jgi:hypothetical protein
MGHICALKEECGAEGRRGAVLMVIASTRFDANPHPGKGQCKSLGKIVDNKGTLKGTRDGPRAAPGHLFESYQQSRGANKFTPTKPHQKPVEVFHIRSIAQGRS